MDREDHLYYCSVCTKRQFNPKKGIVCSLTGEKAGFDPVCPDFSKDEVAYDNRVAEDARKKWDEEENSTYGLSRLGIKNQVAAGSVILIAGILWSMLNHEFQVLFPFTIGMIIVGIVVIIRGISRSGKDDKKE